MNRKGSKWLRKSKKKKTPQSINKESRNTKKTVSRILLIIVCIIVAVAFTVLPIAVYLK